MKTNTAIKSLVLLLASSMVVACTPGGGGGDAPAPAPQAPRTTPDDNGGNNNDDGTDKKPAPLTVEKYSNEYRVVQDAQTRAKESGKKLMVVVSSADSAGSALLEEKLSNPTELKEKLEKDFVIVTVEKMFFHNPEQLVDFVSGGSAAYYPSVYLNNPERDEEAWTILPLDSESTDKMESALNDFLADKGTAKNMRKALFKMLAKEKDFTTNSEEGTRNLVFLAQTVFASALEFTVNDFSGLTKELDRYADDSRTKDKIDKSTLGLIQLRGYAMQISRGEVTWDQVLREVPAESRLISATASIGFYARVGRQLPNVSDAYGECLQAITTWRDEYKANSVARSTEKLEELKAKMNDLQGQYDAALNQGETLKAWDLRKKTVAQKVGVNAIQRNIESAEQEMELTCTYLGFRSGAKKSANVETDLDSFGTSTHVRPLASVLSALNGDFNKAIETRQADVDSKIQDFEKSINEVTPQIATLEGELAQMDENSQDHADLKKEIDAMKEFVRVNQLLIERVEEAFGQLKNAWDSKSHEVRL